MIENVLTLRSRDRRSRSKENGAGVREESGDHKNGGDDRDGGVKQENGSDNSEDEKVSHVTKMKKMTVNILKNK